VIDLSAIDANTDRAGEQAFNFNGGPPPLVGDPVKATLYVDNDGTDTFITADVDGRPGWDFRLTIAGVHVLDAADFVL
jgi:hypothetical protein